MKLVKACLGSFVLLAAIQVFAEADNTRECDNSDDIECSIDDGNAKNGPDFFNHDGDHDNNFGFSRNCGQIYSYWQCERTPNCDWQWNRCVNSGHGGGGNGGGGHGGGGHGGGGHGGGGHGGGGHGGGGHGGQSCYNINSWRMCANTPGCNWDRRSNRCE